MTPIEIIYEGDGGPWLVGRAAQRGTVTLIEYADEHLTRGADLAPIHQPPDTRSRRFVGTEPDHLPGLLADAHPDSWGRLVVRRDMRRHGIEHPTPLQILTWLGRRTMGALTFRPVDGPPPSDDALIDLDRVQQEMLRHLNGLGPHDLPADALTRAAGSGAGGARPKITAADTTDHGLVPDNGTVPDGSTPWLVKFRGTDDTPHLAAIEATYLQMAAAAGTTVCDHRLLEGSSGTRYLAVRRFDRTPTDNGQPRRVHMATAAGLLEAYPEYHQHRSYDDLIRLTRRITGDTRDVTEMVRRAVFNVIAHNRDDHARNTSFLWSPATDWRLAPAYDLTHSMGPRPIGMAGGAGEHYLDIAGRGTGLTRADLHSLATPSGLSPGTIDEIIDATLDAIATWPDRAAGNGVPDELIHDIAGRLPALA
jgi:serine/threonine-protein kinase HipA